MTRELSARGYDMIGIDGSADMLGEAYSQGGEGILYLLQDMREFELYGTVGATVCCLDSLNYLLDAKDLKKTFSLVHNYSDPDALFMFDMNTPHKFERVYADNAYILEDESADGGAIFCGWQNFYNSRTGMCDFYITMFSECDDGRYERYDETQSERMYTLSEIKSSLQRCGMEFMYAFGNLEYTPGSDECERIYIVAKCRK